MQIPVLVEPVSGNGYRARGGEPFAFVAEGPTREQAIQKLRELIAAELSKGAELVQVDVPAKNNKPEENAWLRIAGTLDPNDPMVQEWEEEMKEYRDEVDNDPDRL